MNIYVAGKYEDKKLIRAIQMKLLAEGHTITFDWTGCDDTGMEEPELTHYRRMCADNDLEGVRRAGLMVLIDHASLRGALVETGYALAVNVPVLYIQRQDGNALPYHIFTALKEVACYKAGHMPYMIDGDTPRSADDPDLHKPLFTNKVNRHFVEEVARAVQEWKEANR